MKLDELNESAKFNFENGLVVYLDKQNKTFRFTPDKKSENLERRGLTKTIKSKDDYTKISKKYTIDSSLDDFIKVSNEAKRKNKNSDFRKALAAMQRDIMKIALDKKNKGV